VNCTNIFRYVFYNFVQTSSGNYSINLVTEGGKKQSCMGNLKSCDSVAKFFGLMLVRYGEALLATRESQNGE